MKRVIIIISSILIITSALYIVYLNRPEPLEQEEISVYTEIVENNCIPVDEVVENSKIEEIPNAVVDIVDKEDSKTDNTVEKMESKKVVKKETTTSTKKQESNIKKETPEVKEKQVNPEGEKKAEEKLTVTETIKIEMPPTEKEQEIKEEIIEVKEEIKQDVEEYKINNQMINKLKEIIKNNETEDMKNYGYEIVVDSSIVELTNQFTLTEQRVINKIRLKYGTIRIYSQDYYFNGEYITTQCFII
ncbi:MAG: hypothetical protein IJ966_03080 [Bacilli bacterium]|nr:hypothetical protein [Bacilli bacterium]